VSVLVIGHMTVDPANVAKLWADRPADFQAVANEAKAQGATHHRWAFGEGRVVIIDEWPDAETFQKFFESQTQIPELMQAGGVQGPPEFEILEARNDAPDQF
jgi:hypothetical protein